MVYLRRRHISLFFQVFLFSSYNTHTHTHTQPQVHSIIERAEIDNLQFQPSLEDALRLAEGESLYSTTYVSDNNVIKFVLHGLYMHTILNIRDCMFIYTECTYRCKLGTCVNL